MAQEHRADAVPAAADASVERQRRDLRELAAARRDLVGSITRQIDFFVRHLGKTPDEATALARDAPADDARSPEHLFWSDIQRALAADPEAGQALWRSVKDDATTELATGTRTARTLEHQIDGRPYDRARFAVVVDAFRQALRPRDGLEELLVHQMAGAYELHLRWQARAVQRMELDVWQGERDKRWQLENMSPARRDGYGASGWMPPRLSEADAVEQAVLLADRYQRAFLRLMKAFRDNRRLFGALIVAGGQVNIADGPQQVNVGAPALAGAEGLVVEHVGHDDI